MPKYRKKPVEVEAWQFNGTLDDVPEWLDGARPEVIDEGTEEATLLLPGIDEFAWVGDWIVAGDEGDVSTWEPGIFRATYEPVD